MDVHPSPDQSRATRLLTASQAAKAHIERFRYLSFGIARTVCLAGVVGLDAIGGKVLEAHPEVCG
jgi:hypothetical protein